jgi:Protein of unknown function (DUF1569)
MKNLFEAATVEEVQLRIVRLLPDSERLWGKMTSAQAMAHCSMSMEWAVGEKTPPRMFVGRILGAFVKPMVFKDDAPLRRNSPTSPVLIVQGDRNLEIERERLRGLVDRFCQAGQQGCTTHPHSFFGRLTPEEWAILMYKHLDHHLRQFGV